MNPTFRYITKILLLALLYIITGKLGLLLAVPPGYATVIWPPSGIALGALIMHGKRLWPGILLGSFLLNCYISGAYSPEEGLITGKIIIAFSIAVGSTVQTLIGRMLIARFIGLPLKLNHISDIFRLFMLAGPLVCLIAASVGISTLYYSGVVPASAFIGNWLAWWEGDMFGILVFLPLMLVAPGSPERLIWRNNTINGLSMLAMIVLIMPLGITFYAWKFVYESNYQKSHSGFEVLVKENEKALMYRLNSYKSALLGGAGFFQGSESVERDEWRHYVEAIKIRETFPGMSGIGFIEPVKEDALKNYLNRVHKGGAPDFKIHPQTKGKPYYIVTYVEPIANNQSALGLNIAFEDNRLEAINKARDTGNPTISKRIVLVQDEHKTPGFLLIYPLYRHGVSINTPEERQVALRGWIYAAFIAKNFLGDLTRRQSGKLNLRIYDSNTESPENLIYSSNTGSHDTTPAFTVHKSLEVMQQKWLVVWDSTTAYEQASKTDGPAFILTGGLLFTGLFGVFLIVVTLRCVEAMEWMVGEKKYALPLTIFAVMAFGSYLLYSALEQKEQDYVRKLTEDEAIKIKDLLITQTNSKLSALKHMAQRWEKANGTPYPMWQDDAMNFTHSIPGLRAMEWVDSTYHVRWVEPLAGNEKAIGLNIIFDKKREEALNGATERNTPTLTPPLDLVQGYKALITYMPLNVKGKFDGFIVGIFSLNDFFRGAVTSELGNNYVFTMSYEGKDYFTNNLPEKHQNNSWAIERNLQIYDKQWDIRIIPTEEFIAKQQTLLPMTVLVSGLLIAALSALSVRMVLISRLRAVYLEETSKALQESSIRHQQLVNGVPDYSIYWLDTEGHVESWNSGAERIKGYTAQEIIGQNFARFYTEEDQKKGIPQQVLKIALAKGKFKDEGWRVRKDGTKFWASIAVAPLYSPDGMHTGFAKITRDITEQKKAEQERNKLIAIIEDSADFIGMADLNGNLQYHNRSARRMIGLPDDYDLSIMKISDMHPKWVEELLTEQVIPTVLKTGSWLGETALLHKDGREISVLQNVSLQRDAAGKPSGFTTIMRDISERKKAEEALKASEETFRLALENASIGMALVEPGGRFLKANQALCDMLGYDESELIHNDFQSITHTDDLEQDIVYVSKMLTDKIKTYQMEKRYYHKTGRIIWVLLSVSLVRKPDGTPNYFISQIQDITERKEMERIKSEFISIVSHELRTPLTSIRGSLGLILGALSKDLPQKVKGLIDIAHNNCERLILLINDILDIDKIAAGQMRFDMKEYSLAEITQQGVKANEAYAAKLSVSIELSPIDADIHVVVDAARYIQVLSNLLSNAAKFSHTGKSIKVMAERSYNRVRLSVSDSGPGIPEEFRTRIFGKFSQADSSVTRSKGGTGLGLHIAKQITEHMKGSIGFDTEIGKGTTFWIEFPIINIEIVRTAEASSVTLTEQSHLPLILHVEDDADLSNVLATALHDKAQIVTATTLRQAEYDLKQQHFSMLILDIGMPDGNGLALLDSLDILSKKPLPVVILSADSQPEEVHKRVAAVMVKSRMSETRIVDIILTILKQHLGERYDQ